MRNRCKSARGLGVVGLLAACGMPFGLGALPALAGPQGEQVVRGQVSFDRQGPVTNITASHNSIINYRSFDVGAAETVRFIQPGAEARVLNRIQGGAPTRIEGQLLANGRVYLVNPAGVFFGRDAVINTGAIMAAAGHMSDGDFLRGVDRFTNLSGAVVNEGRITSGSVILAGSSVINAGSVSAPRGTVVFAAGDEVYVGERGGRVFTRIKAPASPAPGQTGVSNTGSVTARRVNLSSSDVYGIAISTSGRIRARDVRVESQGKGPAAGGAGVVQVSGSIDATGGPGAGGSVRVLGDKIALDGASIDASGASGGGRVLVGGNELGRGPERNASAVFVSADSTLRADATGKGDGGRVVVWSDASTRFYGTASAVGGARGGDGGFIETSSKEMLDMRGWADASASGGRAGVWLIDPRNVTIAAAPTSGGAFGGGNPDLFTPNANDAVVNVAAINTALNGGTSVVITTSDPGGTQAGNITQQAGADILKTTPGDVTLTLLAASDIVLNGQIRSQAGAGELNLVLVANDPGQAGQTGATGTGGLTFNGLVDLLTGDVVGSGASLAVNTAITAAGGSVGFTIGGDALIGGVVSAGGGAFTLTSAGSITVNNDIGSSGALTLHSGTDGTGNLSFGAAGVDLSAPSMVLRAGNNPPGAGGAAVVNAAGNAPRFRGAAGGATKPGALTIHQDAAIADATLPAAAAFGEALTAGAAMTYTLVSGSGGIAVTTASKVDGAILRLASSANSVSVGGGSLTLRGLQVLSGPTTFNGASFTFSGPASLGASDTTMNAGEIDFTGGVDSVTGTGVLTLLPLNVGTGLRIGGSGDPEDELHIDTVDLAALGAGFARLDFGYATGSANDVNIEGARTRSPTRVFGGSVSLEGDGQGVGLFAEGAGSSIELVAEGGIRVDADVFSPASVTMRSGRSGTGDITFGSDIDVTAPVVLLRAGSGLGTTARVLAAGNATLAINGNGTLTAAPQTFELRQDAALSDSDVPGAARFARGAAPGARRLPRTYSLRSDGGALTVTDRSKIENPEPDLVSLTLYGQTGVTLGAFAANPTTPLRLASLLVNDGAPAASPIALNTPLDANDGAQFGSAVTAGWLTPTASDFVISSRAGVLNFVGTLTLRATGANALVLEGNEIELGDAVSGQTPGASRLVLQPFTADRGVTVGGASTAGDRLDLEDTELARLQNGLAGITIGREGGTGLLSLGGATSWQDPVVLRMNGAAGRIVQQAGANITGTGDASVRLVAGLTTLEGDITTAGDPVLVEGPVVLAGPVSIDTTSGGAQPTGTITFTGTIDSESAERNPLSLRSGLAADIDLRGDVGLVDGGELGLLFVPEASVVDFDGVVRVRRVTGDAARPGDVAVNALGGWNVRRDLIAGNDVRQAASATTNLFDDVTANVDDAASAGAVRFGGQVNLVRSDGISEVRVVTSNATDPDGEIRFVGDVSSDAGNGLVLDAGGGDAVFEGRFGGLALSMPASLDVLGANDVLFLQAIGIGPGPGPGLVRVRSGGRIEMQQIATAGRFDLTSGVSTTLFAPVRALSGDFASGGAGSFVGGAGATITAESGAVTLTHAGGVGIGNAVLARSISSVSGLGGFATTADGLLSATSAGGSGAISLDHGGPVLLNGNAQGQTFSSVGAGSFTNNGFIAAGGGVTVAHGGDVTHNGTVNAALSTVSSASGGTLTVNTGFIEGDAGVTLHGGTDGTGDLVFTAGGPRVVRGRSATLRAGDGAGGGAGSRVLGLDQQVTFVRGAATPGGENRPLDLFVLRQDASIADADIPEASVFAAGLVTPAATGAPDTLYSYRLISDEGGVTLSTPGKLNGLSAWVSAATTATIDGALTPRRLRVDAATLALNQPVTAAESIVLEASAGQINAPVQAGSDLTLTGRPAGSAGTITINSDMIAGADPLATGRTLRVSYPAGSTVSVTGGGEAGRTLRALTGAGNAPGLVTLEGTPVSVAGGLLVLKADGVDWSGPISAGAPTARLQVRPDLSGVGVGINAPTLVDGRLEITLAELQAIADGFELLTFGDADLTGAMEIGGAPTGTVMFRDPALFLMGGPNGSIRLTATGANRVVAGSGDASLIFNAGAAGLITLSADILTAGRLVQFEDPVVVAGTTLIDTTSAGGSPVGADVRFLGRESEQLNVRNAVVRGQNNDPPSDLTVLGGTGGVVQFRGRIGENDEPLPAVARLTVIASEARFFNDVHVRSAVVSAASVIENTLVFRAVDSVRFAGALSSEGTIATPELNSLTVLTAAARFEGAVGESFGRFNQLIVSASGSATPEATFATPTVRANIINVRGDSVFEVDSTDFAANESIALGGRVNSGSGLARTVRLQAGTIAISGDVGTGAGGVLGALDVVNTTIPFTFEGSQILTQGPVSVAGPARLRGANLGVVTITTGGGAVNLNGALTGDRNLRIDSGAGATRFGGDVGNSGTAFGATGTVPAIALSGSGLTTFAGELFAASHITAAGPARFERNATIGGTTASSFLGNVELAGTLERFVSTGGIRFGDSPADVTTISTSGTGGATVSSASGSTIDFFSTVEGPSALTVNNTGTLRLRANMGQATPLAGLNAAAGVNVLGAGGASPAALRVRTGSGGASFGATRLDGPAVVDGGTGGVLFSGALDSFDTRQRDLSLTATNADVRLLGAVGLTQRLGALVSTPAGTGRTVIGGTRVNASTASFGSAGSPSALNLTAAETTLDARTLEVFGPITTGAGTALFLTDTTPPGAGLGVGSVRLEGGAGTTEARLSRLSVDRTGNYAGAGGARRSTSLAGQFFTGASTGRAAADTAYVRGPVVLAGDTTVDAGSGGVFFQSTIDSDSPTTPRGLTLLSQQRPEASEGSPPGLTSAEVNGSRVPFRFGGDVGGTAPLGSLVFGAFSLTPNTGAAATILFAPEYGEGAAFGRPLRRTLEELDRTFVIRTGTLDMGPLNRMTVFGSLRVDATTRATLSDIAVAGTSLAVNSPDIQARRRPSLRVVDELFDEPTDRFRQEADDSATGWVSGGTVRFTGDSDITMLGSGRDPQVATPEFEDRGSGDPLRSLVNRRIENYTAGARVTAFLAAGAITDPEYFLALTIPATGPTNTRPFDAGALPQNEEIRQVQLPAVTLSDEAVRDLRQMGLTLKRFDLSVFLQSLVGRAVYQDAFRLRDGNRWQVGASQPRLNIDAVRSALDTWYDLVGVPRDEDGTPQRDEDGNVIADPEKAQRALEASWEAYAAGVSSPDGVGFVEHLGRKQAAGELKGDDLDAVRAIARLHNIVVDLEESNLSAYEVGVVKREVIRFMSTESLSAEDLMQAVDNAPDALGGESASEGAEDSR